MASTLLAHCGGRYQTRDSLASLVTPSPTRTHRPIPHHELATTLVDGLQAAGAEIVREQYATDRPADARIFGAIDLRIPGLDAADFSMAIGIRAANDRSMSLQLIAAARVFVCDNMMFSGADGAVCLRRKHTSGLNLARVIPDAVARFLDRAGAFRADVDRMRGLELTDDRARAIAYGAFSGPRPALPLRLLPTVHRLYFADEAQRDMHPDRTLWGLNQAFTEAVKATGATGQAERGRAIGRYFAETLHRRAARPPIATIDGVEVFSAN